MATFIPSINTCKFDSTGERRFARLLEAKLELSKHPHNLFPL